MSRKEDQVQIKDELDDEDRVFITDIFLEDIAPKLMKMHARIGSVNCDLAGEQYSNWLIHFTSTRSGFDVLGFEYDEEARSFKLVP